MSVGHFNTFNTKTMNYYWNTYGWKWVLACTAGEVLGIGAAAAMVTSYLYLVGEPQDTWGLFQLAGVMLFAGIVEGFLLGIFQWRVLVRIFPRIPGNSWISMTVLAALTGWLIGALSSVTFSPVSTHTESDEPSLWMNLLIGTGAGILLGALFGIFQVRVLKRFLDKAELWILANALGWGIGLVWIFIAASIPNAQTPLILTILLGIAGGTVAGLSVGGITGWFLMRLIYLQPHHEPGKKDVDT